MADVKVMDVTEAQPVIPIPIPSSSLVGQNDEIFTAKEDESEGEDSGLMQTSSDSADTEAGNLKEQLRLVLHNEQVELSEDIAETQAADSNVERNGNGDHHEDERSENGESVVEVKVATPNSALNDVGNKLKTEIPSSNTTATPKKSNLKRRIEGTPDIAQAKASSSKRIRIVENLDAVNQNNYMRLTNERGPAKDFFPGVDDSAEVSEVKSCGETIFWLNSPSSNIDQSLVNVEYVRANLSPVKRNFSVEIDMRFVLTETVTSILACKSQVMNVGPSDFDLWTTQNSLHCHPSLNCVYKDNFIKMANIDALLNYDLTSPKELITSDLDNPNDGIYFVGDLYQSSRGFLEYLLWKTSQNQEHFSTKVVSLHSFGPRSTEKEVSCKAGLLLHEPNKMKDLPYLPMQMVEEFAVQGSQIHNILQMKRLDEFVKFVHSRTSGGGLHLFVADNSEVSKIYESCREIRFQKYFYVQCLLGLSCVREGGTFVCKIFDSITLFTNGLLFLMYKCFKSITIHKTSSSPTHTAERFLICKGKIENQDSKYVIDFLCDCLDMVVNNQEQRKIVRRKVRKRLAVLKMEVQALVPLKVILSHAEFFQFVRSNNIRFSTELIESIQNLCSLLDCGDKSLLKAEADRLRNERDSKLSLWNISLKSPVYSDAKGKDDPIKQCLKFLSDNGAVPDVPFPHELSQESIATFVKQDFPSTTTSFIAFPVQGNQKKSLFHSMSGLFFASENAQLLYFNPTSKSWELLENFPEISLPWGTLIVGEIAEEIHQKQFVRCFHIFDAVYLNSVYIGGHAFNERRKIVSRFIRSVRNPTRNINQHISMASCIESTEIPDFLQRSLRKNCMGYIDPDLRCYIRDDKDVDCLALFRGFLIMKAVQDKIPTELFKAYEQHVWYWKNPETSFNKTDLEDDAMLKPVID